MDMTGKVALMSRCVPPDSWAAPLQVADPAALDGPQDFTTPMVAGHRARCDLMVKGLPAMGCKPRHTPRGVLPATTEGRNHDGSMVLVQPLFRSSGMVTPPGAMIGPSGEGHTRFAHRSFREIVPRSKNRCAGSSRVGCGVLRRHSKHATTQLIWATSEATRLPK